jgi:hypothetical protein
MAMELLTFHDQLVAFFPSDDQDSNLIGPKTGVSSFIALNQ